MFIMTFDLIKMSKDRLLDNYMDIPQILRTVNWSFTLNNGAKTADPALPNSKALRS